MGLFSRTNTSTATVPLPEAETTPPRTGGVFTKTSGDPIVTPPAPPPRLKAAQANAGASVQLAPVINERTTQFDALKVRIHQQLVDRLDVQNLRTLPPDTVRAEVRVLVRELCQSEKGLLTSTEQERLMDEVMDETFGLGPLEALLKDVTISDILINKYDRIFVERKGRLDQVETFGRSSIESSAWSGDASMRPARWWTLDWPTVAASTPSSHRWRWMARR
jgi:pilus assembly protein CpaF